MSVVVITPPAPLVSLALVKQHLRVDGDGEDALITAYLAGACGLIDGPDGWLGRAIGEQTLEWSASAFPIGCGVVLPYGPPRSITSISYTDLGGVDQVWAEASYRLAGERLLPAFGGAWPTSRLDANAVRVRYVAGYSATPPGLVPAILLMVGDAYRNREPADSMTLSDAVLRILRNFKNTRV